MSKDISLLIVRENLSSIIVVVFDRVSFNTLIEGRIFQFCSAFYKFNFMLCVEN